MWVRALALEDLSAPETLQEGQGRVECQVVDEEGASLLTRLYLRSKDGAAHFPPRSYYYEECGRPFHLPVEEQGRFAVALPAGDYEIIAMRGFEYWPARAVVHLAPGETVRAVLRLQRAINLPRQGWYCGDHHCHLHFHGSSRFANMRYEELFRLAQGEGLNYLAIQADEHYFVDFFDQHRLAETAEFIGEFDTEYTSGVHGHFSPVFIHTRPPLEGLTDYWPMNYDIIKGIVEQGGAAVAGHPYGGMFADDPLRYVATSRAQISRELPIDLALGLPVGFDLLTKQAPGDFEVQLRDYYRMLNCGFRVAACGATDTYNDQGAGFVGTLRTYVHAGTLDFAEIAAAYRRAATFVTNGPLILLEVNGAQPGDEVNLAQPGEAAVAVKAFSVFGLNRLELLLNGEVVATQGPSDDGVGKSRQAPPHSLELNAVIPVPDSSWIAARAFGPACEFVNDAPLNEWVREQGGQFAHTSPVWVLVAGRPVRASAEDAQYWIDWIDAAKTYVAHWRETTEEQGARQREWYEVYLSRAAEAQAILRAIAEEAAAR